jgi:hypothetical protein
MAGENIEVMGDEHSKGLVLIFLPDSATREDQDRRRKGNEFTEKMLLYPLPLLIHISHL